MNTLDDIILKGIAYAIAVILVLAVIAAIIAMPLLGLIIAGIWVTGLYNQAGRDLKDEQKLLESVQ